MNAGVNVRLLPLSPLDGFVLSRVDGNATVADIADLTSLELDVVVATLEKLVGFDALEWADGTTSLPSRSVPPASANQIAPSIPRAARPPAVPMPVPRESSAPARASDTIPDAPPLPTPPAPSAASGPAIKVFGAPATRQSGEFGAVIRGPSGQIPAASGLSRPPSVKQPQSEEERSAGRHVHSARDAPFIETFESKPRASSPGALRAPEFEAPPEPMIRDERRPLSVTRMPAVKAMVSPRDHTPIPVSPRDHTPIPGVPLQRVLVRRSSAVMSAVTPEKLPEKPPSQPLPTPPVAAQSPVPAAPETPTNPLPPLPTAGPEAPENDLSEEKRKRIDDMYVIADLLDHYQVLGVARTVDRAGVKTAYFELSKVFHPDTAFRKNVGTYRHKMEVIFKRLTESYDVLSKKKLRDEYDAYLARSDQSQTMEETLSSQHNIAEMLAQMNASSAPAPALPPESSPLPERPSASATSSASRPLAATTPMPTRPTSAPPMTSLPTMPLPTPAPTLTGPLPTGDERTMSDAAKKRAQELLSRRLDAGRSAAGNTRPLPAPPPPPPSVKASKSDLIRGLTNSLKNAAQLTGVMHDPIAKQVQDAHNAMAKGELSEAVRGFRHALLLQPDNAELQAEHDRAAQLLAASLADNYAQQAVYEERHKKWAAAAASWAKVSEGRPLDAGAHWRSARALLEANGDVKLAAKLARRATELAPEDVFAARTLGRAYLAAGMSLNAKRELERAVMLDPDDLPTKALLKEIKG